MSDYKAFRIEQVGKIAHVQINRPDKVNAMNADFWREIIEIFQWVDDNDAVAWWCFPVPASTFPRASI